MKIKITVILAILFFQWYGVNAQQTLNGTIKHDDRIRSYILYIPATYTGSSSVPLVFNFHGFNQSTSYFMKKADFRPIADTANVIVCYPQGALDSHKNPDWNMVRRNMNNVDDIGFIDALMDSLIDQYHIDTTRIYVTGYSNGGYFSYALACELSCRIAAIAPVKGKMDRYHFIRLCDCQHPMPILAINNTLDKSVIWYGDPTVDEVIDFWVNYNHCNPIPTMTSLPNIYPNDNITVERIVYSDGDNGVHVELIKEIDHSQGSGHNYPADYPGKPWYFDSPTEIWNFFSRYDIYGLIDQVGVEDSDDSNIQNFELVGNYPNPFNPCTTIEYTIPKRADVKLSIFNINGQKIKTLFSGKQDRGNYQMKWNGTNDDYLRVPSGTYLYILKIDDTVVSNKMILLR